MPKKTLSELTGMKFSRLTVVGLEKTEKGDRWKCICECGGITYQLAYNLTHGRVKSCGCKIKERRSRGFYMTHGLSQKNKRLYSIWQGMKARCNNTNDQAFHNYGGRGIKVCKSWNDDYKSFYEWAIYNGYKDTLSIDRINNDSNYDPNNCRWVDDIEQARNKRNTVMINGVSLRSIAEERGFNPVLALERYRRGVKFEDLFFEGKLSRNYFKGEITK